jgi:hypothetical protein
LEDVKAEESVKQEGEVMQEEETDTQRRSRLKESKLRAWMRIAGMSMLRRGV